MKTKTNQQLAMEVSIVTIIGNVILSVFKLIAGITGHSAAMVSDAVHSASDVLSTFVVIAGVKLAGKQSDTEHPYGHERMECVAALILSFMLAIVGAAIGVEGIKSIASGQNAAFTPGVLPLAAAVISIVSKEAMYWYTRAAGKKIHSGALMADAWHHRSDALSSIGSLAGILGARMGIPVLDSLASVIICLFILKVAYDIFKDSINKMIDRACDPGTTKEIESIVLAQEGVCGIDSLKTRLFGDKIYVDVEISANQDITLERSHEIAQLVHDSIESRKELVKHCMVHVNPVEVAASQEIVPLTNPE